MDMLTDDIPQEVDYLRPELTALTPRIAALPRFRGYPIPWFVGYVNGEPEFRGADVNKFIEAIKHKKCWVCGGFLGDNRTFPIGPMCAINRITSEPPCHLDCAEWSVKNCPFLGRPHMVRRGEPIGPPMAGDMILRNPGVIALWSTKERGYKTISDGEGGILFSLYGEPLGVTWWREGRTATRQEVDESIMTGYPALHELAVRDGGVKLLESMALEAEKYYP